MRRILCALLTLAMLALSCAFAEDYDAFDLGRLAADDNLYVYLDDNRIDVVYRPADQPFEGTLSEGQLLAFIDYVELAEAGVVALRFAFAVQTFDLLYATQITLSCGDTVWTREITPITTEYDSIYMEDYYLPVTGEGFNLIEALLAGGGELNIALRSADRTVTGTIRIPPESLRPLWETWQDCGGLRQDLERLGAE